MALWKARALTPEQKVQIADEESEANTAVEEEALAKNLPAMDEEVEAKSQAVDEESEAKSLRTEESGSFLGVEDVNMSMVYSSILSLPVSIYPLTDSFLPFSKLATDSCFIASDEFLYGVVQRERNRQKGDGENWMPELHSHPLGV